MQHLLVTGGTGLVGRYVLRELLSRQRPLAVIVRTGKLASASDRVEAILQGFETDLQRTLPRPVVIEGDLREQGLGLTGADERWIAEQCGAVLHSAASMIFKAQADGEPQRTNVEGTRALVALCERTGVGDFHHVSTAYLCGLRAGRVLETEIDLGQDLGNVYEASKLAAEKVVRAASKLARRTFYRPGSIVGDSRTGFTTSYHGFYLPLQLAYTMCSRIPPEEMGDRFFAALGLRGSEGKNFVPVDWVAGAIAALLDMPWAHGQTYHLTAPQTVNVRAIQNVIQQSIRLWSKRKTATAARPEDLETCEALFRRHMEVYRSHWRDDPTFDRTHINRALPNSRCPEMTHARLMATARYAIENNFATLQHQAVERTFDGDTWFGAQFAALDGGDAATDGGDESLTLEVSGSGGGVWHWRLNGGRPTSAGIGPGGGATCYLSSPTLALCSEGAMTVNDAVRRGLIAIEGCGPDVPNTLAALAAIVSPAHAPSENVPPPGRRAPAAPSTPGALSAPGA